MTLLSICCGGKYNDKVFHFTEHDKKRKWYRAQDNFSQRCTFEKKIRLLILLIFINSERNYNESGNKYRKFSNILDDYTKSRSKLWGGEYLSSRQERTWIIQSLTDFVYGHLWADTTSLRSVEPRQWNSILLEMNS